MGSAAVAFRDFGGSIHRLPLAAWLAIEDIHGKYRRTVLGPLWIAIGQATMILGFALVFSGLFHQDPKRYLLYLAAGLPVWTMISQFLTDMPFAFIQAKGVIESYELPWMTHIWRRAFTYLFTFLHHIVILFIVMAILGVAPNLNTLLAIPALIVVQVAGAGAGLLVAVVGARYRDLQPAMQVATPFLMLLSPVIWRAEQLHLNEWVVRLNPLAYYIKLVRDPLMGNVSSPVTWIVAVVGAVVLFGLGMTAFIVGRRRLYHWL